MIRRMLLIAATVALSACSGGDDDSSQSPAPVDPGAGSFVLPTPIAIPLSAAGPDQLQSATAGPSGTFYAAGFAASTVNGARMVTVVKLTCRSGVQGDSGWVSCLARAIFARLASSQTRKPFGFRTPPRDMGLSR